MDFEKRCCTHTRRSLLTHTQFKVHAQTTTIMIANVMSAVDRFKTQTDSAAGKKQHWASVLGAIINLSMRVCYISREACRHSNSSLLRTSEMECVEKQTETPGPCLSDHSLSPA